MKSFLDTREYWMGFATGMRDALSANYERIEHYDEDSYHFMLGYEEAHDENERRRDLRSLN